MSTKSKKPETTQANSNEAVKPRRCAKAKKEVAAEPTELPPEPAESSVTSFADMARGYLALLEDEGRSESTINGYRAELRLAASVLGEERPLAEITPEVVEAFLASEVVTLTRDGREKSKLSTDRTARVLRQALEWAADA